MSELIKRPSKGRNGQEPGKPGQVANKRLCLGSPLSDKAVRTLKASPVWPWRSRQWAKYHIASPLPNRIVCQALQGQKGASHDVKHVSCKQVDTGALELACARTAQHEIHSLLLQKRMHLVEQVRQPLNFVHIPKRKKLCFGTLRILSSIM